MTTLRALAAPVLAAVLLGPGGATADAAPPLPGKRHGFAIGDDAFLLDGKPFVIRTGEMHFTRVPREYWRHRLQLMRAMGMNAVCAYLFWNYHEFEQGTYRWDGQADAAAFCRIAQEEGLWVVLRPGPYVCAEWDGGGLPWWLLKHPDIELRTRDPKFMRPALAWFREVGRVLGPLQVTRGGPILLAQVENEYGSYGDDARYMGELRQGLVDAGFDIPLFTCNPVYDLGKGNRPDLFHVVNFGRDAAGAFRKLRAMQPKGPLMCGEFYPGWFDTWGAPHHTGNIDSNLAELREMLRQHASFSLYMAHGGTTPGLWPGADRPFKPDTNSYDYDAPISEAGWIGEKFDRVRALMGEFLQEGETLPDPPPPMPVAAIPAFRLTRVAPLFENLPAPVSDRAPRHMEAYDQGQGCILYRTRIPAGPAATLQVEQAHDFAWVSVDGRPVGTFDRRTRRYAVQVPARERAASLDILVEAMGHVNFGREVHDRKGIQGAVKLGGTVLAGEWQVFPLRLDARQLESLTWRDAPADPSSRRGPAFWSGSFELGQAADTFLDLRAWGKGVIWINGHCVSRFWNIGPTQTVLVPGAWLKAGSNRVVVLDLLGPTEASLAGLETPILDQLRPELDFASKATAKASLRIDGLEPAHRGAFPPGGEAQELRFARPANGRQVCIEMLDSHDGKPHAAIAEFDLSDDRGRPIPHQAWSVAYVSSEELVGEDGSATNAIDGQTANFWHSEWKNRSPGYPHRLVIDLGANTRVGGIRYTPRAGANQPGRIRNYRIFVGDALAVPAEP